MSVDSLDDLWTTIDNSLRHFDPAIRVSKELFDHLLRQGDIVFIFDGFDELCGHRLSPLKAIDILNELRSGVSSASDARVLLTSRTVYWDEEVGSEVAGIGITDLATFTKPQAFDYFEQRFRDDPVTRERARQLFGELRKGNQPPTPGGGYKQFPYHPLVIQLVADAATHGIDELPGADEGRSPVLRVLRIFCEREIVRQKLNTSSDAQLRAFQDMAVELFLDGTDSLAIEIDDLLIAGFDERDRPKLPDHPFVLRSASGHYCFRYEFLVNLLVARHIVHSLQAVRGDTWSGEKRTLRIMDQLRSGKHSVLDHIGDIWTSEISKLGEAMALIPPNLLGARSFIFQLTKHLVNIHEHLSLRADRSDRVLTLLGAARTKDGLEVSSLYIVGNVEKFDLSRIRFNRCTFIDVQFIDCQADESTIFDHCIFEGELELSGSREMWGKVKRNDCRMDSIVKLVWSDVDAHSRKYDDDVLHEALAAALGKFWKHAHLKGSISASDWNSGVLGRLQIASKLKDIMMRVGLIKPITISGVSEGGYAIDREAIACIQQFMDNRQLTGKVADVYRELKKS